MNIQPKSATKHGKNVDIQQEISKSRATKEEVKKATEKGIKKYGNALKELAKR